MRMRGSKAHIPDWTQDQITNEYLDRESMEEEFYTGEEWEEYGEKLENKRNQR